MTYDEYVDQERAIEDNIAAVNRLNNFITDDSIKNNPAVTAFDDAVKSRDVADITKAIEAAKQLPSGHMYKEPILKALDAMMKKESDMSYNDYTSQESQIQDNIASVNRLENFITDENMKNSPALAAFKDALTKNTVESITKAIEEAKKLESGNVYKESMLKALDGLMKKESGMSYNDYYNQERQIETNIEAVNRLNGFITDDSIKNNIAIEPFNTAVSSRNVDDIVKAVEAAKQLPSGHMYKEPMLRALDAMMKKYTKSSNSNSNSNTNGNSNSNTGPTNTNPPSSQPNPANPNATGPVTFDADASYANFLNQKKHGEPEGIYASIANPGSISNEPDYYVALVNSFHQLFKTFSDDDFKNVTDQMTECRKIIQNNIDKNKEAANDAITQEAMDKVNEESAKIQAVTDKVDELANIYNNLEYVKNNCNGFINTAAIDNLIDNIRGKSGISDEFITDLENIATCKSTIQKEERKETFDAIINGFDNPQTEQEQRYATALEATHKLANSFMKSDFENTLTAISQVDDLSQREHLMEVYNTLKYTKEKYIEMLGPNYVGQQITSTAIDQLLENVGDDNLINVDLIREVRNYKNNLREANNAAYIGKGDERIFTDESRIDASHSYLNVGNAKNLGHYDDSLSAENVPLSFKEKLTIPVVAIRQAPANLRAKAGALFQELSETRTNLYLVRHSQDYGMTHAQMAQMIVEDMAKGIRDAHGDMIDPNQATDENSRGMGRAAFTSISAIALLSALAAIQIIVLGILFTR